MEERMAIFADRIFRAAKLEVRLYQQAKVHKKAMDHAVRIVVLASLAAGLGSMAGQGLMAILLGSIAALITWCAWALSAYLIGTQLLPEPRTKADLAEFARTVGFAASPGLAHVLGIIPPLAATVLFVTAMWMLMTMVIAVKEALDYLNMVRAVVACMPGWIVYLLIGFWLYTMGSVA
jgi:hypothetical protein